MLSAVFWFWSAVAERRHRFGLRGARGGDRTKSAATAAPPGLTNNFGMHGQRNRSTPDFAI
jgi:hypothetical protein